MSDAVSKNTGATTREEVKAAYIEGWLCAASRADLDEYAFHEWPKLAEIEWEHSSCKARQP